MKRCIDADGGDCGLFFSPEGFNSGGYGEFTLEHTDARRIAGRFVLAQPEDFMGESALRHRGHAAARHRVACRRW